MSQLNNPPSKEEQQRPMDEPAPASPQRPPPDLKARLKEAYDAIAPTYNAWTESHHRFRMHYLSKLLQHLPSLKGSHDPNPDPDDHERKPALAALELGCGCGVPVTEALLSAGGGGNGIHVTANDLSATQLALARQRVGDDDPPRLRWVQGDMMDLDFPPASLDIVVGMYSVIHLPREEQRVLMGRIAGWLRPGGVVLVNFGREEMEGMVMERWLGEEKGWMYWSGLGEEGTVEMVRGAGLEVVMREVSKDEGGTDAEFLWVIARKK